MATTPPAPDRRSFRADLVGDVERYSGVTGRWLHFPWRSGECVAWLLIGPALGAVFALVSILDMALSPMFPLGHSEFVVVAFVGIVCGVAMAPVMAAGAWRRSAPASAGFQFALGCLAAAPWPVYADFSVPEAQILGVMLANVAAAVLSRVILPRRPLAGPVSTACERCGYDLCGLPEPLCPECGHAGDRGVARNAADAIQRSS